MHFLVVGTARSGTTFLSKLLNENSKILIGPETHFLALRTRKLSAFFTTVYGREWAETLSLDVARFAKDYEGLVEQGVVESGEGEIGALLSCANAQQGRDYVIGEKTPSHLRHTLCFSKTNVIIIQRNFRDNLRSLYLAPWVKRRFMVVLRRILFDRVLTALHLLLHPKHRLKIRYEDLVGNRKAVMERCLKFLGIGDTELRDQKHLGLLRSKREFWKSGVDKDQIERRIIVGAWPRIGETNPRNTLMYDNAEKLDERISYIDLKGDKLAALLCDAVHFHWPEKAFQGRFALPKGIAFLIYVLVLKIFRVRVLQTVHNDYRDEIVIRPFRLFFEIYLAMVDHFFLPSASSLNSLRSVARRSWSYLPLGVYPAIVARCSAADRSDINLIAGRLTRKKGVLDTLRYLAENFPNKKFLVVGEPEDEKYRRELANAASAYPNVKTELVRVDEERLHQLIAASRSVVIDYKLGTNSGLMTLAASYGTPIMTSNPQMASDLWRNYGVKCFPLSAISAKEFGGARSSVTIERVAHRLNQRIRKIL